jgi:hypothetical protein
MARQIPGAEFTQPQQRVPQLSPGAADGPKQRLDFHARSPITPAVDNAPVASMRAPASSAVMSSSALAASAAYPVAATPLAGSAASAVTGTMGMGFSAAMPSWSSSEALNDVASTVLLTGTLSKSVSPLAAATATSIPSSSTSHADAEKPPPAEHKAGVPVAPFESKQPVGMWLERSVYYFAYGTDMDTDEMRAISPRSLRLEGCAQLLGYTLILRGPCQLGLRVCQRNKPIHLRRVLGVVYRVPESDLPALQSKNCDRKLCTRAVERNEFTTQTVMFDDSPMFRDMTGPEYAQVILRTAEKLRFGDSYTEILRAILLGWER